MKRVSFLAVLTTLAAPLVLSAETWKGAVLLDAMCAGQDAIRANPDSHTVKCALQCEKAGFGILTADGVFLEFDGAGNHEAVKALKAAGRKDHLRATVEGERQGNRVRVRSVALAS